MLGIKGLSIQFWYHSAKYHSRMRTLIVFAVTLAVALAQDSGESGEAEWAMAEGETRGFKSNSFTN